MKKIIIVSLILVALTLTLAGCAAKSAGLSPDAAKAVAEKFINENLMETGQTVTISNIAEEAGLYKLTVQLPNNQAITSYLTKDGKKFFDSARDTATATKKPVASAQKPAEVVKSDKPTVELFVMSHCPYGTQIEKGIIPVVETLGSAIDFDLKFCDYAMHGKKEVDEELQQYCIKKDQPAKFMPYLKCFLGSGDGAACAQETKIDLTKLSQCVKATDSQYKITEKFNDKSAWISGQFPTFDIYKADNIKYGVQGSPTLIINGAEASSSRDSAGLLKTICDAFNTPPAACSTKLPSDVPSPGFGSGTAASTDASAAQCH